MGIRVQLGRARGPQHQRPRRGGRAGGRVGAPDQRPGQAELGRELADYVRRCSDREQVRAGVDADQVGLLLAAGYFATLTKWISVQPEPFDLRDELLKMADLMLHGRLAHDPV
jgi:hypothetical protein